MTPNSSRGPVDREGPYPMRSKSRDCCSTLTSVGMIAMAGVVFFEV